MEDIHTIHLVEKSRKFKLPSVSMRKIRRFTRHVLNLRHYSPIRHKAIVLSEVDAIFNVPEARKENNTRFRFLANGLMVLGLMLIMSYVGPTIVRAGALAVGVDITTMRLGKTAEEAGTHFVPRDPSHEYQPKLDKSLPMEDRIIITSAGIDTVINESSHENYEVALTKGVWRIPEFGNPYDRKAPMILAAHRFGYLKWSIPYRLKNSFFNLPKVKEGDVIEIIWNQRKYKYAVYAESKGEEIVDYEADLILYTCEDLSSEVRIFKYARLLEV